MPGESGRTFFDTNVLLYLLLGDRSKSLQLDPYLLRGGLISVQVLNEIVNVARRKYRLQTAQIRPFLTALRQTLHISPVSLAVHDLGVRVIERYGLSTYDAMIVAAALEGGCETLLSEDMQDGLSIFGELRIKNPFSE